MKNMFVTIFILLLFSFSMSPIVHASVISGFTGDYATDAWQYNEYDLNNWWNGGGDVTGAPDSFLLVGSDNFSGNEELVDFTFTAFEDATISFDWSYLTYDIFGSASDPFGWLLNGTFSQLTYNSGDQSGFDSDGIAVFVQNGIFTADVKAGDVFGFRALSTDGLGGNGETMISNFTVDTVAVPEPSSFLLLCLVLLLFISKSYRHNRII